MTDIIAQLKAIVGEDNVLSQAQVAERAKHFWDPSPMLAMALVRPQSTAQVSDVLRTCYNHDQKVVTHGGVTGLVDGEKSTDKDIILSLERMREIESVNSTDRTMTVQAGCILQTIHETAAESDLLYGLDLGARGSCTIGGNISTNAGGLSVLRYGMTRDQILGLEAVLADGTIVSSMNAMIKNNAGYDLKQLFIGSEGTLGVVTRAVLRLRPNTSSIQTAIVAFDNFDQVKSTLRHVSNALNAELNAFEIMWNNYYALSTNPSITGSSRAPLSTQYHSYAIIESRGTHAVTDEKLSSALEQALENELIVDAVIAQSESERADIWQIRENVDLVLKHQPLFIYDISLPISSMQDYINNIESTLKSHWPDVVVYAYGHLADGNLHISVAPKPGNYRGISSDKNHEDQSTYLQVYTEEQTEWYQQCNKILFEPLSELGGSISAEHGIGLLKKSYLHYSRNAEEIALMKTLKKALDTKNLLNPGKII